MLHYNNTAIWKRAQVVFHIVVCDYKNESNNYESLQEETVA